MFCNNNSSWIIILLVLVLFCNNDGCGMTTRNSCGCGNSCGCC